jgi:hypothetical protein
LHGKNSAYQEGLEDWNKGLNDYESISSKENMVEVVNGKRGTMGSDMATQICQGRRGIRSDKDGGHERGIDDME